MSFTKTVPATSFNVVNGGLLTVSFYGMSSVLTDYLSGVTTDAPNSYDFADSLYNIASISIFKKPSKTLKPVITLTSDRSFTLGSTVSYSVSIIDSSTNKVYAGTPECYVNLVATDESAFTAAN